MKKSLTILLFLIAINSQSIAFGQIPTYEAQLKYDNLIAPNLYEFDIYIKNIGNVLFEAYGLQVALSFNDSVRNGGEIKAIYIPGSSEMSPSQIPNDPSVSKIIGKERIFQLAGKIPSSAAQATIISDSGDGTKIGRFRILTTAKSFSNAIINLKWVFNQEIYEYATKFHAYVNGLPKDVTLSPNHFVDLHYDSLAWWSNSEIPKYQARLMNYLQIAPNEYEFDIYVKKLNPLPLEVFGFQVCLLLDDTICNGGTLTGIYVPETSEMFTAQIPNDPNLVSVINGKRVFKLAGKIPPRPGEGTLISEDGTRLGRFRIVTSAEKFANMNPKIVWNFDQTTYNYATKFFVYSKTVAGELRGRDITTPENHLNE